ncbi:lysophospholipase, putative [Hepatocystis sp. ex Piliocolobus tephrosceles]|nr:lysophospholipase, putative [Hepatocystis sp. ex Piliocolobus tephrosceles]
MAYKNESESSNSSKVRLDGNPKIDYFHNKDNLLIRTYAWQVKDPIGALFLVHGFNSHVRFEYMKHNVTIENNEKVTIKDINNFYIYENSWIDHINKKGFSVYAMDLQGHGESEGYKNMKLNVRKFDDFVYDYIQYMNRIHDTLCLVNIKSNDNTSIHDNITSTKIPPFYLMGLSMGGNIVYRTLELLNKSKDSYNKLNIKGCVSLAGMLSIDILLKKPIFKYFLLPFSKVFATIIPYFRVGPGIQLKRFAFVQELFKIDTYVSSKPGTCNLQYECLNAIKNINNDINYIPENIPLLFIHSKEDSLCDYEGVKEFYNKIKSKNKEFFTLEGMDHMITMEPGYENVMNKVIELLTKTSESA